MKKTQKQKIEEVVKAHGYDLTSRELKSDNGEFDCYSVQLEDKKLQISFHSETGKFSQCGFVEYNGGGGGVFHTTFTKFLKSFEPSKEYGIVEEVEGSEPKVGVGGTLHRYTDADPVTVVEVVNEKKIVVRYDKAELDESWKPDTQPGGFAGHTSNNYSQKWNIEQDENGATETYTLRKNGHWVREGSPASNGQKLKLGYRSKFYDYNF